jgi:hypothetical protein
MQISDFSVYAPHCSACWRTFDSDSPPLKATCSHIYCAKCVSKRFICPYDGSISTIFQTCDELQTLVLRFYSEDFDLVLDALYDEINTVGVPCRYTKTGKQCPDQVRCHYTHTDDLMQSMEPIFPEEDLLKDYIVIEAEEQDPTAADSLLEALWRLLRRLRATLEGFRTHGSSEQT